jgi:hypothetical protein
MQTLEFLKNIDWYDHDGVGINMINDFIRNQFYNNIFKQHVSDKHCLDIGFGTGLLSIMALANNAKSVIAYESDNDRYRLGQLVIDRLGLGNKIQLIHDRYDHTKLSDHTNVELVFTETVNGNLWFEGLFNSLPRYPGVKFLPNSYFLDLYAIVVPNRFAQGIQLAKPLVVGFNPYVDIDLNFIKLINKIGFPEYQEPVMHDLTSGIIYFDQQQETPCGWMPYLKLVMAFGEVIASYNLNAETMTITTVEQNISKVNKINFTSTRQTVTIDTNKWKNNTVLIVPRVGMAQDNYRMNLDSANSWGPTINPILVVNPTSNITVTHDFYNGDIKYNLI